MRLVVWDVEHGACAMLQHVVGQTGGRLAMIDSGCTDDWRPSAHITQTLGRRHLDYLFLTNADQDHMSDLDGLWRAGITLGTFHRNFSYTGSQIRAIKRISGPLTTDAERYAAVCDKYIHADPTPFDLNMGGIVCKQFWNPYSTFTNTNDLSLVVFFQYEGFKILFPGDLERAGWLALLQRPDFRNELAATDVLVASHHGRESGYCEEMFNYFTPSAIVISDKPIAHDTQQTVPDYRAKTREAGVMVRTTAKRRHVLTTRRDGWIQFTASQGRYFVDTEYRG